MKRILLASSLLLFSCEKEQPKVICDCYELVYRKDMWIFNSDYILIDITEHFEDVCVYDGNERFSGDLKWVKVCQ
jgi:hypothetical protein